MKPRYEPPKQSGAGQFFDSAFLLVLVYVALFTPLILGLTGAGSTNVMPETVSWETLEQNEVMQGQWEKLGYTPDTAAEIITTKFDYSIDPLMLLITAVVIIGYFVFLVRVSDKEYRDVIAEKFDH
ncbi:MULTISPECIES: hypothetical protein [Roseovarius]|uniref:Uncharacterized protein n=1 Tax=Roseovarius nubinhibens TaxID=314263 RepID=A0A348W8X7_9RHOB|nr:MULTISPECIES: hypothetical protein [Roseovarius]MAO27618.1 hypothetical protein [Roseovarius sp.]MAZ21719.1 hypothetical protein [Roseovarius sp.]MBU3000967.1 hypothetical protein [Roseovarius nubinhibens]HAR50989.1 hypothetical protein [Roseovarius nubinhibens]|tara:strand:+ start:381 stop:758 length:378 start_codon:yes stop_codon:yes gene_type:complete|eukprot:m.19764 g.19764  ORF g.19764 m.19764 type:complete len:126 (+) comp3724_c0_seq1:368-745(+)